MTTAADEAVLRARAQRLARGSRAEAVSGPTIALVVVTIGSERIGIPTARIFRVAPRGWISALPNVPRWCVGLAETGGQLVTVVDLDAWLGRSPNSTAEKLAVLEGPPGMLAILIDGVVGVVDVEVSELAEHVGAGPYRAVTRDLVSILDLDALFESPRIHVGQGPRPQVSQTGSIRKK